MLLHVTVSGRVQGVGFRYTTQQKAKEHGLTGWVQNQSNGTVELEVEGKETSVNSFLIELESGFNQFIRVDDITVEKIEEHKGYNNFSIK
ncbi:acylphosphatase [Virgibacillus subterraneus]|uniref:Acylphosphatase n=1 Tax=Virgibacillus subterraneus TaxID=621109 RepID=A0A1H9ERN3_9BACI|nr:acylphosphatase [Virgibacillus subterraneus]SEQ28275.1 acylphosphatase [Virgibacillus subterraneus]